MKMVPIQHTVGELNYEFLEGVDGVFCILVSLAPSTVLVA